MADLNKELSEYLLSNKNEKQYKITLPSVAIPKPNLGKWLGRNSEEDREEAGWLRETQKDCCPSMVSVYINITSNRINNFNTNFINNVNVKSFGNLRNTFHCSYENIHTKYSLHILF